jgi:hypothetical protein
MDDVTIDSVVQEDSTTLFTYEVSDEALEAAAGNGLLVVEPTTMLAQPGCC